MDKKYSYLISAKELFDNLHDPNLVIFDCRFDLLQPAWGNQDYQNNHIPRAFYANLNQDLSAAPTPNSGAHPLPETTNFMDFLSKHGVNSTKQVVVYDTSNGNIAVRLWWLLSIYGHKNVALLNGGLSNWANLGYPLSDTKEVIHPSKFESKIKSKSYVDLIEIERRGSNPDFLILDARSPERYRGEVEPFYSQAGHIPGAINWYYQNNLDSKGLFLPEDLLMKNFTDLLTTSSPEKVIHYCGSGVTSLINYFVMEMIGLKGSRIYIGSWSEWIKHHPDRIAKG